MTGFQTDRVEIPLHTTASAALFRLASPFFGPGHSSPDLVLRRVSHEAWVTLRSSAEKIIERRGLFLSRHEQAALDRTLELCPDGPDREMIGSLDFIEKPSPEADERDRLVKAICESVRTYAPEQRLDAQFRMRVRLQKTPIKVLRQILEEDVVNCSAADFVREAMRA